MPVPPVDRLVTMRMSSIGSTVAPVTTRTRMPARSFGPRRRMTRATIVSTSAIFAFSSSRFGSMSSTPSSLSRRRFAATAGLSIIDSWAAGATRIGMPEPRAFVAYVVTVESSIAWAILPIVFAVPGATRRRSAFPSLPQRMRYSIGPVAAQLARQLDALNGGDAPRDPGDERLALQLHALHAAETLRRMHRRDDCRARYISVGLPRKIGTTAGRSRQGLTRKVR